MNKKYVIFDMDGTMIESMAFWRQLGDEYLRSKGVPDVPDDLLERVKPMTMTESAALFIHDYDLPGTPETVVQEMLSIMDRHYREDIPIRKGVKEYLQRLKDRGIRICLASASDELLASQCLQRLGVLDYFEFLLSCETTGISKEQPDIYFRAAERFGAKPEDIAVYEDALYAARTAKNAGFYLVGVYEETASHHWDQVKAISDEYISDWETA